MANGNGQNNQITFLSSKPSGARATIQIGRQKTTVNKATGKKDYGPTVWGPVEDAHVKPISRERFLEGSSFDPRVPLNPNLEIKRTRLSPEAAEKERQAIRTERQRQQRLKAFRGTSPVPDH